LVTVAACAAAMGRAARLDPPGGFDYASDPPLRVHRPADAHPLDDRERSRESTVPRR
jgi:hypothetical protein